MALHPKKCFFDFCSILYLDSQKHLREHVVFGQIYLAQLRLAVQLRLAMGGRDGLVSLLIILFIIIVC